MTIGIHTAAAVIAVILGAVVLGLAKGTPTHRRLGRAYVVALGVMVLSSFTVYEIRSGPSVFHLVSLIEVVLVTYALGQTRRRRRSDWMRRHAFAVQLSYLVLVVTGIAQFFDRLPLPSPALNAVVFLQLPLVLGFVVIARTARTLPT